MVKNKVLLYGSTNPPPPPTDNSSLKFETLEWIKGDITKRHTKSKLKGKSWKKEFISGGKGSIPF